MAHHLLDTSSVEALATIAVDAGRAIMEIYNAPEGWDVERKADDSPLTQADLQANDIIVAGLAALTPEIPVLSEESPWCGGHAATYWAVDPLDGTKEFIKRNGEFTVNIALVIDGVARMGLIYAPALKTLWAGIVGAQVQEFWAGRASFDLFGELLSKGPNWTQISVENRIGQPNEKLRLLGSRSHGGDDLPNYLRHMLGDTVLIEKGSSLKFCLIAQGDADIYVRMGPTSIWDTAAGHAILVAAGGTVINTETQSELTYQNPREVLNPSFIAYPYPVSQITAVKSG
jgi:3'(2'), 5'-bisphosphate nucleotidase